MKEKAGKKENRLILLLIILMLPLVTTCGIDSILYLYPPDDIDEGDVITNRLDGVKHPGEQNAAVYNSIIGYDVFYSLFETADPADDDYSAVLTVPAVKAANLTNTYPIVSKDSGHEYYRLFKGDTAPVLPLEEFYSIPSLARRGEEYRIIFDIDLIVNPEPEKGYFYENDEPFPVTDYIAGTEEALKRYVERSGIKTYLDFTEITSTDQDYMGMGLGPVVPPSVYAYFYVFVWGIDEENFTKLYSEDATRIGPFLVPMS